MIRAAWNTGCLYTAAGQRIAAEFDPESRMVRFADYDRMVDGEFPLVGVSTIDAHALQQVVTTAYNYGTYTGIRDFDQSQALYTYARENCPMRSR